MEKAHTPLVPASRLPRRKWKIWLSAALLALGFAAAPLGFFFYQRHQASSALQAATATADAEDPGWRLEDIDVRRAQLQPHANGAIPALKAAAFIPDSFPINPLNPNPIGEIPPLLALSSGQTQYLLGVLKPLAPALPLARQTLHVQDGNSGIDWETVYLMPSQPGQRYQKLAIYLKFHVLLASQLGQHDEAWLSALTILGVSRAIGEDPTPFAQFVRLRLRRETVGGLERALAQAPRSLPDPLLEQAQSDLAAEFARPLLMQMLRGQRACLHLLFVNLEVGKVDEEKLFDRRGIDSLADVHAALAGSNYQANDAWVIDYFTRGIAIAKKPSWQQLAGLKELEAATRDSPPLARQLITPVLVCGKADLRALALLQCAMAGIGVERFRVATGDWPKTLDDVVAAKFLGAVPLDVYDGKPLRYRKTPDGVVVYSVGPDGTYQGDALDQQQPADPAAEPAIRYDFCLWNPGARAARPPRRGLPAPGEGQS